MEKDRRIKVLSIIALLIAVAGLTIAFAAVSKTLTINGTAKMDTAAWDIHFISAEMKSKKGDAKEVKKPEITNGGIDLVLKVSLRKPKDEIVYSALIKNAGDIDAEIESIEYPTLTDDQKKVLEFEATYEDGTPITEKQELKSKDDITVKIVIRYKDITDESLLATTAYDIPLTFKINYVQKGVGSSIPSIPEVDDGSKTVLYHFSSSAVETSNLFRSPIKRNQIESITFSKGITPVNENTWDASEAKDGSIIGYYEDSDGNELYEVYIESESNIYAPADSYNLFAKMKSLKEINFNNFKTNDVTDMSGMFEDCSSLISLDLRSFNTSSVTDMFSMFYNCTSLTILDLSSFNTSNVISMFSMFDSCESLTSLDLNSFNTSNVTEMDQMFNNCYSLTILDLSNFNTANVTTMYGMFALCDSLSEIRFNSADFSNVVDYYGMFLNYANTTIYVKDEAAAAFVNTALQEDNATGQVVIQPLQS